MKKGEKTKDRLLEIAAKVISRIGLDQFTLRSFAKAAKVSPGHINYHFPVMSEVFPQVVGHVFSVATPMVRKKQAGTALERLLHSLEQNFEFYIKKKSEYYRCIQLSYFYVSLNPRVADLNLGNLKESLSSIEKHLRTIASENGLQPNENIVAEFAQAIFEQLEGGLIYSTFFPKQEDRQRYIDKHLRAQHRQIQNFLGCCSNSD
jgi:AcrR family transcriptional regulator